MAWKTKIAMIVVLATAVLGGFVNSGKIKLPELPEVPKFKGHYVNTISGTRGEVIKDNSTNMLSADDIQKGNELVLPLWIDVTLMNTKSLTNTFGTTFSRGDHCDAWPSEYLKDSTISVLGISDDRIVIEYSYDTKNNSGGLTLPTTCPYGTQFIMNREELTLYIDAATRRRGEKSTPIKLQDEALIEKINK